jgi:hypothetical protein
MEGKACGLLSPRAFSGNGRSEKAWQDLVACLKCARTVGRGPLMANADFATDAERHALVAAVSFVEHAKLSRDQMAECLADLSRLPPPAGIAEKIDRAERYAWLDLLASVPRRRRNFLLTFLNPPPFHPRHPIVITGNLATVTANRDDVLRYVNEWYDRTVDAASQPTRALQEAALDKLIEEP